MIHCYLCGRFVGLDGFIDVFYDDYAGGCEEGYSMCARCLRAEKIFKEVKKYMVECLDDIKGFRKLNYMQRINFAFRLKEFLETIDKDDLNNHDLDYVKRKNGKFLLGYTRFDVCKEVFI